MMQVQDVTGAQRAAILMMFLDRESAADLYASMSEADCRRVGEAIADLGSIPPEIVQAVVEQFCLDMNEEALLPKDGFEYLAEVFPDVVGKDRATKVLWGIGDLGYADLKARLVNLSPGNLLSLVRDEHPQTAAVICAVMGPQVSTGLIAKLPDELQADILHRLARMDRLPVEVLDAIQKVLDERGDEERVEDLEMDGASVVADCLRSMDRNVTEEIVARLSTRDEELGSKINRMVFSIDLIKDIDDRGLQVLLKEVERRELALALKGASEIVHGKVYRNMSENAAMYLKEDLEVMGPVRLRDVEEAQMAIIHQALRLEEQGRLIFMSGGDDEYV